MKLFDESSIKREIVLKNCFECIVESGLEFATIRKLCKATGLKASSIYYRFSNKEQIILEATIWGLKDVTSSLFWSVFQNIKNFEDLFSGLFDEINENKKQLKLIYQVAESQMYCELLKKQIKGLDSIYTSFASKLALELGCNELELTPYVRLFIAVIREYILWDDTELAEKNLHFIYSQAIKLCNKKYE